MGKLSGNGDYDCDYEEFRRARIQENQARLACLGLNKALSELRAVVASPPKSTHKRKCCKVDYRSSNNPLRRSNRLNFNPLTHSQSISIPLRRSTRLNPTISPSPSPKEVESREDSGEGKKRVPNASLVKVQNLALLPSPEVLARRCASKSRGTVYNSIFGICCHFCRQKTLCSEQDCKRCGNVDAGQPCIGKTDCSVCHSSTGIFCRACLKVRYGEELEEVRENKNWMCPHCIEDKGINPYWVCNSSFCLKKRKIIPTGVAIYRAREMGYESVAHLLMDELRLKAKCR